MSYSPSKQILQNYANILVNYALGNGKGIKPGDVVQLVTRDSAKLLYEELYRAVILAGGHVLTQYTPDDPSDNNLERFFFSHGNKDQINFYPQAYYDTLIDTIDHRLTVLSEENPHSLKGIDPKLIMQRNIARSHFRETFFKKVNAKKATWTLALYATEGMAKEAGLSLEAYWEQIIDACYLREDDPVATWKNLQKEIHSVKDWLNALDIRKVHVKSEDADLWITIGEERKWMAATGQNIPSYEIFTSPDWRGTEGWIRFNQPLYRYGNLIEGIELEFKNGLVVNSKATKNENVLKEMIATKDADKVGEFSLTDKRHSRITKFMANTLYDENVGGEYGNTHIAVGMAYKDAYNGDPSTLTKEDWERLGLNDSVVHTDIMSTKDRTVTAVLSDGSERVIYKDGMFQT